MDKLSFDTHDWVFITLMGLDVYVDVQAHHWDSLTSVVLILALMYRIGRLRKELEL